MADPKNHSGARANTGFEAGPLAVGLLLSLPVLLCAVGIVMDILRSDSVRLGGPDLAVALCIGLYLSWVVFISRRTRLGWKFVLLVYAVLGPVAAVESIAFLQTHNRRHGLPALPRTSVSTAANTMPGIKGEISFTVNHRGFRAPDHWPASRQDRILCVGGSTTECLYVTDEKSWPWLAGTRLSDRLGRPVLVANAGRSGHFTLHHLYLLRHYDLADRFGTVLVLCGQNDASTLLRGNYPERAVAVPGEALIRPAAEGLFYQRLFIVNALKSLWARQVESPGIVVQDSSGKWHAKVRKARQRLLATHSITSVPAGLPAGLATYASNLVEIIELCTRRNQRLVFATQPTLYHPDMSPKLAALLWQQTETGAYPPDVLAAVIAAYNATLMNVCRQYDVPCIDLASNLPKDTSVFYDDCHFNVGGCEAVANLVCEFLEKELR